jgi:hypothetical protein
MVARVGFFFFFTVGSEEDMKTAAAQ